jgi:hypothetical protein
MCSGPATEATAERFPAAGQRHLRPAYVSVLVPPHAPRVASPRPKSPAATRATRGAAIRQQTAFFLQGPVASLRILAPGRDLGGYADSEKGTMP